MDIIQAFVSKHWNAFISNSPTEDESAAVVETVGSPVAVLETVGSPVAAVVETVGEELDLQTRTTETTPHPDEPFGVTVTWTDTTEPECFNHPNRAQILHCILKRAVETIGPQALETIASSNLWTGRPFVSRNPSQDFVNRKTNKLYTHHQITNTEWYVFTHTDTKKKVEDLKKTFRVLGIQRHSIHLK